MKQRLTVISSENWFKLLFCITVINIKIVRTSMPKKVSMCFCVCRYDSGFGWFLQLFCDFGWEWLPAFNARGYQTQLGWPFIKRPGGQLRTAVGECFNVLWKGLGVIHVSEIQRCFLPWCEMLFFLFLRHTSRGRLLSSHVTQRSLSVLWLYSGLMSSSARPDATQYSSRAWSEFRKRVYICVLVFTRTFDLTIFVCLQE